LSRLSLAVTWDTVTQLREALVTQANSTPVAIYANSISTPSNPRGADGDVNNVIKNISGTEASFSKVREFGKVSDISPFKPIFATLLSLTHIVYIIADNYSVFLIECCVSPA
jgi:hypothetical protein